MRVHVSLLFVASLLCSSCSESGSDESGDVSVGGFGFVLAQACFSADNKPLPSRMILARRGSDGTWSSEVVQEPSKEVGGDVFHKALWFEPVSGDPGLLTISANPAFVKIWRKVGSDWNAETIWHGEVGIDQNRLRDVELGDVTGDGVEDIVIVCHDRAVVMVLEQKDGGYVHHRIGDFDGGDDERQWIHEVELADFDGDGCDEIYCTPSAPNSFDKEQPGYIKRYAFVEGPHGDGSFGVTVVDEMPSRHAKEILACDFFGDGSPILFAALEGEAGAAGGASCALKLYRKPGDPDEAGVEVMSLPGQLCRFLACGDVNGDGKNDIVAATMSNGIYAVSHDPATDKWSKESVATSLVSGSFEHAIWLRDVNEDGVLDIIAASDKQRRLQSFSWDADRGRYKREKLLVLPPDGSFFTFNMTPID